MIKPNKCFVTRTRMFNKSRGGMEIIYLPQHFGALGAGKTRSEKKAVNSTTEEICKSCQTNYIIRRITGPIRGRRELTSYQNLKSDEFVECRDIVLRIDQRVAGRTLLAHLCFAFTQLVYEFLLRLTEPRCILGLINGRMDEYYPSFCSQESSGYFRSSLFASLVQTGLHFKQNILVDFGNGLALFPYSITKLFFISCICGMLGIAMNDYRNFTFPVFGKYLLVILGHVRTACLDPFFIYSSVIVFICGHKIFQCVRTPEVS